MRFLAVVVISMLFSGAVFAEKSRKVRVDAESWSPEDSSADFFASDFFMVPGLTSKGSDREGALSKDAPSVSLS